MFSNRDAITIITNLVYRLTSPRQEQRERATAEWLRITDNPLTRSLRQIATSREPLGGEEREILASAWDKFDNRLQSVAGNLTVCCRSRWCLSADNCDGVDVDRLVDHLRVYIATAMAAHWAGQETSTEEANQELHSWLALAVSLKAPAKTQPPVWKSGMAAASRVTLAAQDLVSTAPPTDLLRAYAWTCSWLDALQAERSRTIPIVTVETEMRPLAGASKADLHHIDLDLPRFPEAMAGLADGAAIEHLAQCHFSGGRGACQFGPSGTAPLASQVGETSGVLFSPWGRSFAVSF